MFQGMYPNTQKYQTGMKTLGDCKYYGEFTGQNQGFSITACKKLPSMKNKRIHCLLEYRGGGETKHKLGLAY